MCMTNEAAAIKLAERDNLVGELVEALKDAVCALEVCGRDFDYVMGKAREGAQS